MHNAERSLFCLLSCFACIFVSYPFRNACFIVLPHFIAEVRNHLRIYKIKGNCMRVIHVELFKIPIILESGMNE